eukprot:scaffold303611_cov32-Tisochrysis_lutea.AAC.2
MGSRPAQVGKRARIPPRLARRMACLSWANGEVPPGANPAHCTIGLERLDAEQQLHTVKEAYAVLSEPATRQVSARCSSRLTRVPARRVA